MAVEVDDWLEEAEHKLSIMPAAAKEVREGAKEDLFLFARLVNPAYIIWSRRFPHF